MKKKTEDTLIEELVNALFLEVPNSVKSGFVDAVFDLEKERGGVFQVFPSGKILVRDLSTNPRPARLPKRRFDIESRRRVRNMLLSSVKGTGSEKAFRFLGKVIMTWLLSASKEYLVCDRSDSEWEVHDRNADRLTVVTESYYDIVRSWELNY
jgi:hypothetical protein